MAPPDIFARKTPRGMPSSSSATTSASDASSSSLGRSSAGQSRYQRSFSVTTQATQVTTVAPSSIHPRDDVGRRNAGHEHHHHDHHQIPKREIRAQIDSGITTGSANKTATAISVYDIASSNGSGVATNSPSQATSPGDRDENGRQHHDPHHPQESTKHPPPQQQMSHILGITSPQSPLRRQLTSPLSSPGLRQSPFGSPASERQRLGANNCNYDDSIDDENEERKDDEGEGDGHLANPKTRDAGGAPGSDNVMARHRKQTLATRLAAMAEYVSSAPPPGSVALADSDLILLEDHLYGMERVISARVRDRSAPSSPNQRRAARQKSLGQRPGGEGDGGYFHSGGGGGAGVAGGTGAAGFLLGSLFSPRLQQAAPPPGALVPRDEDDVDGEGGGAASRPPPPHRRGLLPSAMAPTECREEQRPHRAQDAYDTKAGAAAAVFPGMPPAAGAADLVVVEAEKLCWELSLVAQNLHDRRQESDHLQRVLIEGRERAADQALELQRRVDALEDDLQNNETELSHLRLQLKAIEVCCEGYVPQDAEQELRESIRNWKADWEAVRERWRARKGDRGGHIGDAPLLRGEDSAVESSCIGRQPALVRGWTTS